jgi:hypothetical protein
MNSTGANFARVQQPGDSIDNLFQGVCLGAEAQLCAGNLGGALLALDRDLGNLGGLEHAFDEPTAVRILWL